MDKQDDSLIREIRRSLMAELEEWLGFDYPDEGTEDYDQWQNRLRAIKNLKILEDVYSYAAEFVRDESKFLERWGL